MPWPGTIVSYIIDRFWVLKINAYLLISHLTVWRCNNGVNYLMLFFSNLQHYEIKLDDGEGRAWPFSFWSQYKNLKSDFSNLSFLIFFANDFVKWENNLKNLNLIKFFNNMTYHRERKFYKWKNWLKIENTQTVCHLSCICLFISKVIYM